MPKRTLRHYTLTFKNAEHKPQLVDVVVRTGKWPVNKGTVERLKRYYETDYQNADARVPNLQRKWRNNTKNNSRGQDQKLIRSVRAL